MHARFETEYFREFIPTYTALCALLLIPVGAATADPADPADPTRSGPLFDELAEMDTIVFQNAVVGGFLGRVQADAHVLLADEPERVGGTNLGPDRYAFLAAALGTCTVMTLNRYARHKKLPVSSRVAIPSRLDKS